MASLKRFKQLLDSYGAKIERWPERERQPMQALLDDSPEARRLYEDARQFDAALEAACLQSDSHLWRRQDPSGAVARLRARVSAGIEQRASRHATPRPADPGSRARRWLVSWLPVGFGYADALRASSMAWSSAAVIFVGLWIGWQQATPMAPSDLFTILQSALIHELL